MKADLTNPIYYGGQLQGNHEQRTLGLCPNAKQPKFFHMHEECYRKLQKENPKLLKIIVGDLHYGY